MGDQNTTDEVQNKVAISPDDCQNVRKYCSHFGVPSTDDLETALNLFEKDPTYENQMEVKLQICKWILDSKHESFKDSLWDAPKKAAEEVVFDLQFDKDLKEELTVDDEGEDAQ